MSKQLPVSVHILTWNSGKTLESALRSVEGCAEILVIDGGSTDDTLPIAERYGARTLPQRFPGAQGQPLMNFAAARTVGLEQATQTWILCLDSDEKMSSDAMEEISAIVNRTPSKPVPELAAYRVPRQYTLEDGTVVLRASTYPNERIYFFHRDAVERWEKPVHERVVLKPGTMLRRLHSGSLAPLPPLSVFYSKLNQYLRIEVQEAKGKGWELWIRRVLRTLRGRAVASLRLIRIWVLPGNGARLPMSYEMARFWYSWKLIVMTCPLSS